MQQSSSSSSSVVYSFPHPNNTNDTQPLRLSPAWWRCRFLALFSLLGEEMIGDLATPRHAAKEAASLLEIVAEFARFLRNEKEMAAQEAEKGKARRALLQDRSNQQLKLVGRQDPSAMHDEGENVTKNGNGNNNNTSLSFSPSPSTTTTTSYSSNTVVKSNAVSTSASKYSTSRTFDPPQSSSASAASIADPSSLFPNHRPMFATETEFLQAWHRCLRKIFYHTILTPEERKQQAAKLQQQKSIFFASLFQDNNSKNDNVDPEQLFVDKFMPLPPKSALPSEEQMEACLRRIFWVERIAAYYVCANVSVPRDHASVDTAVGQLLLEGHSYEEIWERVQNKYCVFVVKKERDPSDASDDDPVKMAYEALNQQQRNVNNNNNSNLPKRKMYAGVADACTQTSSAFLGNNNNNNYNNSNEIKTNLRNDSIQQQRQQQQEELKNYRLYSADQDEVEAIAQRMLAELGSMDVENNNDDEDRNTKHENTITAPRVNKDAINHILRALGSSEMTTTTMMQQQQHEYQENDQDDEYIPPPPPPTFEEIDDGDENRHVASPTSTSNIKQRDQVKLANAIVAGLMTAPSSSKTTETGQNQDVFDATKAMTLHMREKGSALGSAHAFLPLDLKKRLHLATTSVGRTHNSFSSASVPMSGSQGGLDELRRRSVVEEQNRRTARLKIVTGDDDDIDAAGPEQDDGKKNVGSSSSTMRKSGSLLGKSAATSGTTLVPASSYSQFSYDDFMDPITGMIPTHVIKQLSSTKRGTGQFESLSHQGKQNPDQTSSLAPTYLDPYELRQKQQHQQLHATTTMYQQQNMLNNSNTFSNGEFDPQNHTPSSSSTQFNNANNNNSTNPGLFKCSFHISGVVKSQLISHMGMPTAALLTLVGDFEDLICDAYDRIQPEGTPLNYSIPSSSSSSLEAKKQFHSFTFTKPPPLQKQPSASSSSNSTHSIRVLALNCFSCEATANTANECVQVHVALTGKQRPIAHNVLKACAAEVLRVVAGYQPLFPLTVTASSSSSKSKNLIPQQPLRLRAALGFPTQDGTVSYVVHDLFESMNVGAGSEPLTPAQTSFAAAAIPIQQQQQQPSLNNNSADRSSLPIWQQRIHRFYSHYDATKIPNIPAALEKYKGREDELLQNLIKKYGPEPSNESKTEVRKVPSVIPHSTTPPPSFVQQQQQQQQQHRLPNSHFSWTQRINNFYSHYDNTKISNVATVLEKYKGKEDEMLRNLINKYGPEPAMPPNAIPYSSSSQSHRSQPNQGDAEGTQKESTSASLPAMKMRKLLGLPNHHLSTEEHDEQQQEEILLQQQTASAWKGPNMPPSKMYSNKFADL